MNKTELRRIILEEGLESFGIYYGSYKGFVSDNEDPDGKGRLIVKVPEIYGEDIHEYWALPKNAYAGKDKGFSFIPDVGDGVWVSFEKGDPRFPIWEGGWFIDSSPSDNPLIKKIKTSKCGITFNDEEESITIETSKKQIVINSTGVSLVSDKISLGTLNTSNEKAILGDTLKGILNDLLSAIQALTVTCTSPGSPSSVPVNIAQFVAIQGQLESILSSKVTLD